MRHPHGEKHYASSSESDSPLEQQRDEEAGSGALKGWEWKDAPYGNAGTTAVRSVPHFGGQTLSRLHHTRLQTASANHGTEPNVPLSHVPESPGSRRSQSMPSTPVLQSHSEWVRLLLRLYHNLTPKLLLALVLASLPVMLLGVPDTPPWP